MAEANDTASTRPHPGLRREIANRIPVAMRTFFWAAGIFIVFGATVAILTAAFVDRTQKRMVEVAREEVDQVARKACERIEQVVAERSAAQGKPVENLAEVAFDREVEASFRILSQEQDVLLSALIDAEGKCIYYTGSSADNLGKCPKTREGGSFRGTVKAEDGKAPLYVEFDVRRLPQGVPEMTVPIHSAGREIGRLTYGFEEAAALKTLEPLSRHISQSLAWMAGAIIVFSGFALLLLCRIANRHGVLQQHHAEAQHLASIGTMASGLAHEIRNPLHAMNLHLDAAREELEEPRADSLAHATKTIANVQKQIHSLNRTLTNFMNFALPNRIEQEPVRLKSLAGEVGTLLEPEFAARNAAFERDVPDDAWIHADPSMVRQVLTNVLLNAAQAMETTQGRRVARLTAVPEGGRWTIHVDDTGPGIPAGQEEAIFEVFHSTRKGGTGFGLAIAQRLMEAHRGSIVAANRPDGGARFTLVFPACKAPENYHEVSGMAKSAPETIG